MPGIVVGIDGSEHSQHVLEWAMRQAALQRAPLTVLTVHPVARSQWTGNPFIYPEDQPQVMAAIQEAVEERCVRLVVGCAGRVVVAHRLGGEEQPDQRAGSRDARADAGVSSLSTSPRAWKIQLFG